MKVYHGAIICCDSENTVAEYLVEDAGKIIYVGNELPVKFRDWKRVELGDRALIRISTLQALQLSTRG